MAVGDTIVERWGNGFTYTFTVVKESTSPLGQGANTRTSTTQLVKVTRDPPYTRQELEMRDL